MSENRFRSILVPLDGSELAEQALPLGASLAHDAGVPLHLVTVQEPLAIAFPIELPAVAVEVTAELRADRSEYLARVAASPRALKAPVVRTALLDGVVAGALRQYICSEHIGLVVMTSHGRSGVNRLWLGSVADRLLRTASVPMLLLKPDGVLETLACRRVLMALDGEIEDEVLDAGLALLSLMPEAALLLTRIVEPPVPVLTRLAVQPARFGPDWINRHEVEATNYLARLAERLRGRGHPIETRVLVGHPVADVVLGLAHAIGAGLVVLGTHGSRGVERLLLGSVADKIIRSSDLPLLVAPVRHQTREHGS